MLHQVFSTGYIWHFLRCVNTAISFTLEQCRLLKTTVQKHLVLIYSSLTILSSLEAAYDIRGHFGVIWAQRGVSHTLLNLLLVKIVHGVLSYCRICTIHSNTWNSGKSFGLFFHWSYYNVLLILHSMRILLLVDKSRWL